MGKLALISQAMSRAGAPCLSTISSQQLGASGFYIEENVLSAAEVSEVVLNKPSAGMVVSGESLQWNWRQAGRDHQALFPPENILTSPGGQLPRQWWIESVNILTVYFEPEFLSRAELGMGPARTVELVLSPTGADPVVAHLFWALHHELRAGWQSGRLFAETIATALAARLTHRFSTSVQHDSTSRGGLSRKALAAVTDYIHANPSADLSLAELAKVAAVSEFHFCREFKRVIGKTVHAYVLDVRIERAKQLLARSNLSIAEIAYRSGIPNVSHFCTVFRRFSSLAPAAFRRQTGGHTSVHPYQRQ